jgi:hypothetical protein
VASSDKTGWKGPGTPARPPFTPGGWEPLASVRRTDNRGKMVRFSA